MKLRLLLMAAVVGLACAAPAAAQTSSPIAVAFEDAQLASAPGSGLAVAEGAARVAAADPALRAAFEDSRAAEQTRRALETVLASLRAQGEPAAARARGVAADLDQATAAAASARARLDAVYPGFSDLTDPAPLPIGAVQALLKPREALVFILPTVRGTYVWAVTPTAAVWAKSDLTSDDVATEADRLLVGLRGPGGRGAVDAARPAQTRSGFDRAAAYRLYTALWAPLAQTLERVETVYLVVDGPLRAIPPGVLITAPPAGDDWDSASLRSSAWLQRRHGFALLPAVASLRAVQATSSANNRGFAGFGDALTQAYPDGSTAKALAPLPGTARELRALSRRRGGARTLRLGVAATEAAVKSARLSDVALVAFATHAIAPGGGEGEPAREPALVLSPSSEAEGGDDGFLTATEAAQLHLGADLVILSACDTAQDDPSAVGVNSLSRGFFYAGARALLVSNWRIRDDVAERLSVRTVTLASRDGPGVAAALRQASLEMIDDRSDPSFAHPSQWASFSLLGNGSIRLPRN